MTILGTKGLASFSQKQTIGGLDFTLGYGSKVYELPFSVKLNDFIAQKYPGTEKGYASFMSKVTVEDERPFDYDIFMNHVLDHGGYRFFQSSYDNDEKGTILSVNHDFYGTWVSYFGYFLLGLGFILTLFNYNSRYRDLIRKIQKTRIERKTVISILMISLL